MSLQIRVKHVHQTKPLNNRLSDFSDGFKHSELSHFFLVNFNATQKNQKRREVIVTGRKIAPNTGANVTKFFTFATKS